MGREAAAGISTGKGGGHGSRTEEMGGDLFDEREWERKMVQAQGWEWDEDYDENCDWVDGESPAEVRLEVSNMVLKKTARRRRMWRRRSIGNG